jgi:hypothetical protein
LKEEVDFQIAVEQARLEAKAISKAKE